MANFGRNAPPIAMVLASLILWGSLAWGLPAEGPPTESEGEAEAAPEDLWAGVRISDAYDELRCPYCWEYNELTAARCRSCGHEFPQPSAEVTDPDMVFVPGKGYYREGTVLEPGKSRKGYWIAGSVLIGLGVIVNTIAFAGPLDGESAGTPIAVLSGFAAIGVGAGLIIYGLVARTKPVYAFEGGERYGPYGGVAYALRSPDADGAALKIEVTLLSF